MWIRNVEGEYVRKSAEEVALLVSFSLFDSIAEAEIQWQIGAEWAEGFRRSVVSAAIDKLVKV